MSTGTILSPASTARLHRLALGLLLLLFAGLSVQYAYKAIAPPGTRSAITRWRPQLLLMDQGVDIWGPRHNFPNPPIMALLLRPLAGLSPLGGALAWYYLKVAMTLLALWGVFRLVESAAMPFPAWAKVATVLLALRPIMGDLIHGNVNLFILFLVLAFLYAFHRGRDVTSGLLLGLAIACKVTPALFVPYLVWKRAWKTLAGCALGLVLFLAVVPACFLGWPANVRDLNSWVHGMVIPFVVEGKVTSEHNNQSLPGLFFRLLTDSPSSSSYDSDEEYQPTEYHNLVTLDPAVARWLLKGCMVLFAGVVVWSCRTPTAPRQGWRLAAEFSIILLGMLLFSERTWKHHCVTLALPFGVLCYYLACCRPGGRLCVYLAGSLTAVFLLMASTSNGLLPKAVAELPQVYGAYVWGYLILLAALVVILRRRDQPEGAPAG